MMFDEERSRKAGAIDVQIKKRGPGYSFNQNLFEVFEDCNPEGAFLFSQVHRFEK